MPGGKPKVVEKRLRVDPVKLKRARKVLGTKTDTETVDRALDRILSEEEKNRLVAEAIEEFLKSRGEIRDVYGRLEP